jgi:ribose transport system substrate-binding protein
LLISLASGIILTAGGKLLTELLTDPLPHTAESVSTCLFIAATPAVGFIGFLGFLGFLVGRWRNRGPGQVFVLISAFTRTRWLSDLLHDLSRSLDQHGIEVVVRLPPHDHTGRSQLVQLAALRKRRRSYIGGLIIPAQPEQVRRELADFCATIRRPIVFVDVCPSPNAEWYPADTVFVGYDPCETGERSAQWIARDLLERGVEEPTVLVVSGDAQECRHVRFREKLCELVPAANIEVNLLGQFARDRAREIVTQHLRRLRSRGESLDAVFCANDEMALGAVDAVQADAAAGHSHSDLIVVGVDGIAEAIATIRLGTTPFRATIVQDTRRISDMAVDLLLRMRAGERVPTETRPAITVYPMQ